MGPKLTRKYVFECVLAGEAVCIDKEQFGELHPEDLEELGLIGLMGKDENVYTVLQKMKIIYRQEGGYRDHYLQKGVAMVFRNQRMRIR